MCFPTLVLVVIVLFPSFTFIIETTPCCKHLSAVSWDSEAETWCNNSLRISGSLADLGSVLLICSAGRMCVSLCKELENN